MQAHIHLLSGGLTSLECHVRAPAEETDLALLYSGLPALQSCSLRCGWPDGLSGDPENAAGFPAALLRCSALTSLYRLGGPFALDWSGLPPGISALKVQHQPGHFLQPYTHTHCSSIAMPFSSVQLKPL